ncbi:MAG: hypothetical protein NWR67_01830 [Saprospiraceae bacterium]|nr:hypothetical protein [Saprospiraceae bacterium]MDP4819719.1 hypothetical protein [Saprospiraceae bacterium]
MDLQILISTKGTRVVVASQLHMALQLPNVRFAGNVKKWLSDVYEFRGEIRKPVPLRDFARRKMQGTAIMEDYYLSLELAKMVCLHSGSPVKLKYARWLAAQHEKGASDLLYSTDEVRAAMELVKVMQYLPYQELCEREHLGRYKQLNGGTAANWWKHRASILGYTVDEVRKRYLDMGRGAADRSHRDLLLVVDKYELVRMGVIDLLMAAGRDPWVARKTGDLAKLVARQLKVELLEKDPVSDKAIIPTPAMDWLSHVLGGQATAQEIRA